MNKKDKLIIRDYSDFKHSSIERLSQIRSFYSYIREHIVIQDKAIQQKDKDDALQLARIQGMEDELVFAFIPYFMRLLYIQISTILEIYFNVVLEFIHIKNTNILKNSNKQYSTEEILLNYDMEDLVSYLAMKEVNEFNDLNSKKKIEYLKTLLNKENIMTETLINKFVEVREIRNILVHHDGFVNKRFRNLVQNPKYENIGHIEINEAILLDAIDSMISFISELDKELCTKFTNIRV